MFENDLIDKYKEIVKDQQQIIQDYKELLKMVEKDRDNKTSLLDMEKIRIVDLQDENKQLRRIVSLYDGSINIKG